MPRSHYVRSEIFVVRKQFATALPLPELTCHMGSRSVIPATQQRWHSHLYTQPVKAGTRFSDPGGMQGWVDL